MPYQSVNIIQALQTLSLIPSQIWNYLGFFTIVRYVCGFSYKWGLNSETAGMGKTQLS